MKMRMKIVAGTIAFGLFLLASCGPATNENDRDSIKNDSTERAQEKQGRYNDSVADAQQHVSENNADTSIAPIDSAGMMSTLRVLDSIAALKKK